MLGPDDPLPALPDRILVAGVSGTGKTTLARRIADALDLEHVEIDGLHWGAGWTPRPSFVADVEALVVRDRWVTEWQYREVRERLAERAQLMVWLDPPVRVSMARVLRRTLRRRLRRERLWNGNVEPPLRTFLTDPDHVVRWAWRTRRTYRDLPALAAERHPHLVLVRLHSQAEVDRWMRALSAAATR
ncbi:AAA family ATPase [Agrococcus sp. SGAir0287]|uniref:AAA family ATPase n=1 Tax=Agrococcus sp. SGAir0287 TaxID=2070347 RepID=UPI0010CD51D2|nr:AAA family ATPase [Agrococcus sp. SGAir0287]QCR19132.1 AAA family ATPase [Agrococcus sp. SGAir0287]